MGVVHLDIIYVISKLEKCTLAFCGLSAVEVSLEGRNIRRVATLFPKEYVVWLSHL